METDATLSQKLLSTLSDCLFSEDKPSRRFFALVLTALFGAVLLSMLCLGAAPMRDGAWDAVILLNGGWRIVSGQIPHVDYHNPIGPLTYLLVAFGMKVAGPSTAAIPYGIVLLACILIPLGWKIAAPRFPPLLAFIYVLFNGFLLVAPRPLGLKMRDISYEMIENREGYILISLLFVLLFLPRRKETAQEPVFDGLFAGFLLALIFYCKVTYFIVACASIPLAVALHRPPIKWYLWLALSFAGLCAIVFAIFHIPPWAYIHDLRMAAQAQSMTDRMHFLKEGILTNLPWVSLIFVCLALWTLVDNASGRSLLSSSDIWLTAAWIIGVAMGIDAGNTGPKGDDPLFFIGGLIALELFRRRHQGQMLLAGNRAGYVLLASYIVILPHFCFRLLHLDAGAVVYATGWNIFKRPSFETSRQLHAGPLHDLRVPHGLTLIGPYWYARDFPEKMNDGLDLLRKHLLPGDRVTTFGYTDPFSFAFGLKPCRDGNQWWDRNYSFSTNVYPPANQFLGSATLVMVPIPDRSYSSGSSVTLETMKGLYNNYLQANFQLVETSQDWVLYSRRAASSEATRPN